MKIQGSSHLVLEILRFFDIYVPVGHFGHVTWNMLHVYMHSDPHEVSSGSRDVLTLWMTTTPTTKTTTTTTPELYISSQMSLWLK